MLFSTLIEPARLRPRLADPSWVIVDCRFSLGEPERGLRDYNQAHIPGAVYAHLERDLSGMVIAGVTGRHPLPEIQRLQETFSTWGIEAGTQVVAYDDSGGSIAARLWWMLQWLGHPGAAVLNGGWQAWTAAGGPTTPDVPQVPRRQFHPRPRLELLASTSEVQARSSGPDWVLVDSRAEERFAGVAEPIDPVAGHIPGARNAPHSQTVGQDGRFLSPDGLRARFESLLEGHPAGRAVFYCGSGVTAARNLLALAHAGLGEGRLYAGSWSEWITDPNRPVATRRS